MNFLSKIESLYIGYKSHLPILENLHIEILPGQLCALIGANGSGKTTLIRTWSGLLSPLKGKILFENNTPSISLVPQAKNINFSFPISVLETILMPVRSKSIWKKNSLDPNQKELLEKLGLDRIQNKLLSECSGGQLQKVLICRSLFWGAKLIFLDEPMDALDPESTKILLELIDDQKNMGKSFFLITHNVSRDFMAKFDRILHVKEKGIRESK